ncbi:unnamed protein product [Acanthoscelides obtectus]|uniref:Uncharacterized protein n=1 Tax=Acanthoscelides obtectus TaxID=200917 RepID=A0A9P0NYN4_ACAOB|nr:unnamed protein product [Acanthoscelides obtectus]CAK1641117.1 hypothetical protein AOBTE_LOCUS12167 [Acanthoscelides obtectus]
MLDIESQLAKMEGLNGVTDVVVGTGSDRLESTGDNRCAEEDVNENHNKCHHDRSDKLKQCCELTCVLQDNLKKGTGLLSTSNVKQQTDNVIKSKKDDDDLEPLPVRMTPPLYTYSNPEKNTRVGSESPAGLSDEDSNSCSTNSSTVHGKQNKSLLEQLLIEIPNDQSGTGAGVGGTTTSHSPATRSSMRTRNALNKLGSPADELNSPPIGRPARYHASAQPAPTAKRKRNESDGSAHGGGGAMTAETEGGKKKVARKAALQANVGAAGSEHQDHTGVKTRHHDGGSAAGKVAMAVNSVKKTSSTAASKTHQGESSDSDEPLIEKVRKPLQNNSSTAAALVTASTATGTIISGKPTKTKSTSAATVAAMSYNNAAGAAATTGGTQMNTRRSNRAVKTRSKDARLHDKTEAAIVDAGASAVGTTATAGAANAATIRRKTRSAAQMLAKGQVSM